MLIENVKGQSIFLHDLVSESEDGPKGFTVPSDSGIINLSDFFTRDELLRSMSLRQAEKIGWLVDPRLVKRGRRNFIGVDIYDPQLRAMNMKVLVERGVGGIGDAILVTPALRAIKEAFPNAHLTYATDKQYYNGALLDVMRYNPFIDYLCDIQEARTMTEEFDYTINLACPANRYEVQMMTTQQKVDKDRSLIFCEHVGLTPSTMKPSYVVTDIERNWVSYFKKQRGIPEDAVMVGLVTNTENRTRSWQMQKWYDLAQVLSAKGIAPIFFSPHRDKARDIPGVHFVCGIPIRQVAAIVSQLGLLITPDTGIMHLGGALSIPMVTLWGAIDPAQRILHYDKVAVVAHRGKFAECWPCWYNTPKKECLDGDLGHEVSLCMEDISVEEIGEMTDKMLAKDKSVLWQPEATNKELITA